MAQHKLSKFPKLEAIPWNAAALAVPFSRQNKEAGEGPGEDRARAHRGDVQRNTPNTFPDLIFLSDKKPAGEVKSVGMKFKSNNNKPRILLGKQPAFIDQVQTRICQSCFTGSGKLAEHSIDEFKRILTRHLGKKFIMEQIKIDAWKEIEEKFIKDYITLGGGLHLVSEEAMTILDVNMWNRLSIQSITRNGEVDVTIDRSVLPFL